MSCIRGFVLTMGLVWATSALAGPRHEGRRLEANGQLREAAGVYRGVLLRDPERQWARRRLASVVDAQVQTQIEAAQRAAEQGTMASVLEPLGVAERLLRQAAAEGLSVNAGALDGVEASLRGSRVHRALLTSRRAMEEGRPGDAVVAARRAVADAATQDAAAARDGLVVALRGAASRADGEERTALFDELAALTGLPEDRTQAAEAHGALGEVARAEGDCRRAAEAFRRAQQLDARWGDAERDADACATVDVELTVRGPDRQVREAMRQQVADDVVRYGGRYVRVVTPGKGRSHLRPGPGGPVEVPPLALSLEVFAAEETRGEAVKHKAARPQGAVTVMLDTWERPVTVALRVGLVLTVEGEAVRATLIERISETARWDGRARAVRTPAGGLTLKGAPRSGQAPEALAVARELALQGAVRSLGARVSAEVVQRVEGQAAAPGPRPSPSP